MPLDARDLRLEIDYPNEKHGWIHCFLTFNGACHRFYASGSLPPFHNLLDFLRALTLNRLPAHFFWDEEGYGAYFEAWPLGDPQADHSDFHLRVIHEDRDVHTIGEGETRRVLFNTYNVLWVDDDLGREAVVDALLAPLRDFILYSQQPDNWEVSLQDLQVFEQLRARGAAPRCDTASPQELKAIITRWQDDEEQRGSQFLELRMWEMRVDGWNLDDTDVFWPLWFELLEHALTGRRYEMVFQSIFFLRIKKDLEPDDSSRPGEAEPDWSTRMVATPLELAGSPRRFRLQIYESDSRYRDLLCVDETLDVARFVQAFLEEFNRLLSKDYQPYPDEDGQVFDLRGLPVERLSALLAS